MKYALPDDEELYGTDAAKIQADREREDRLDKSDIPDYAPATIKLPDGRLAKIDVASDDSMGLPWEEHDGHGIVSDWTRRAKAPGERILASDHGSFRYYDFAESVKLARRDGWSAGSSLSIPARQRAALAVEKDFQRLKEWCDGIWEWVGVTVTIGDKSDSLWGIESDGDYWREVAADLINGLIGEAQSIVSAGEVLASLEQCA